MRTLFTGIGLCLCNLLATAQNREPSRLLAVNYQPNTLELAERTLTATNTIPLQNAVEYRAGQSVVLLPGFVAKVGSVFTAHTGDISLFALGEEAFTSLTVKAYPNPFDVQTTISYELAKANRVSLSIRDAEGRLVIQLINGQQQEAGHHQVEWKGAPVMAGTYVCVLDVGAQRVSKRLIRK